MSSKTLNHVRVFSHTMKETTNFLVDQAYTLILIIWGGIQCLLEIVDRLGSFAHVGIDASGVIIGLGEQRRVILPLIVIKQTKYQRV